MAAVDQIYRELLEKTMQDKIYLKAAPQSPAIQKQEGKEQETQRQKKQAGDDETCMQVRTCMIQFACNKDMISLPDAWGDLKCWRKLVQHRACPLGDGIYMLIHICKSLSSENTHSQVVQLFQEDLHWTEYPVKHKQDD